MWTSLTLLEIHGGPKRGQGRPHKPPRLARSTAAPRTGRPEQSDRRRTEESLKVPGLQPPTEPTRAAKAVASRSCACEIRHHRDRLGLRFPWVVFAPITQGASCSAIGLFAVSARPKRTSGNRRHVCLVVELNLCYSLRCASVAWQKGNVKMDEGEPRARHRGFFLHSDTVGEHDASERESPEGLAIRVGPTRRSTTRELTVTSRIQDDDIPHIGRSRTAVDLVDEGLPQIRSGSVTGSRQRVHTHR